MDHALRGCALALVAWLLASRAGAQQITRDNYLDFLPAPRRLVTQATASARLNLYGDTAAPRYRDRDPVDGIDDARGVRLLAIAERFSPILRPNNFSVPRDFREVLGGRAPLVSDTWVDGRRVRSDTVYFDGPSPPGTGVQQSTAFEAACDTLLLQLLSAVGPRGALPATEPAKGDTQRVLYFDMPGSDPPTWRAAHAGVDRAASRIFGHPFIHETDHATAERRYQLVLQFWFYYPFNDGANAHEGDWEHVNVITTTAARARESRSVEDALLTAEELEAVLSPDVPVDSLVIAAVNYYVHQHVVALDYIALLGASPPRPDDGHYAWEDLTYVERVVRARVAVAGGRLATHPIVHVGGDHKGPMELIALRPRFRASLKRNSGASYPFPGVWQTVSGFAVTESVRGGMVPEVREDSSLAWYDVLADPAFLTFRAPRMILVPDWERVIGAMLVDARVARQWGWLALPIRWGFPVSRSPGAGIMPHTNVGNIAPTGLTSHSAWNRVGETPEHTYYRVRVLRTAVSPGTPWALVRNGWGVLNLPLVLFSSMPVDNVLLIEAMPWVSEALHLVGAPPRRTFTPNRLPSRFTTEAQGLFIERGGEEFARLLSPDSTDAISGERREHAGGQRVWLNMYFGERFSLENTLSRSSSVVSYTAARVADVRHVSGNLEMWQLTGGARYDLIGSGATRAYARAGYGWLRYRARTRVNGAFVRDTAERWRGYITTVLPSSRWVPNVVYAGGGMEIFSPRRYWLFGWLGYGVRAEYGVSRHRLQDAATLRHDIALALVFGW